MHIPNCDGGCLVAIAISGKPASVAHFYNIATCNFGPAAMACKKPTSPCKAI